MGLVALAVGLGAACSSAKDALPWGGKSDDKKELAGARPAEDDDENEKPTPPIQVSGAFLVCGVASDKEDAEEATGKDPAYVPRGCGFRDAFGKKEADPPTILAITASFKDGTTAEPALKSARAASLWHTLFGLEKTKAKLLHGYSVALQTADGEEQMIQVDSTDDAEYDGEGPTPDTSKLPACAEGLRRAPRGTECERILSVYRYVARVPNQPDLVVDALALVPDRDSAAALEANAYRTAGYELDGVSFKALPPLPCPAGHCELYNVLPDGSIPIFRVRAKSADLGHRHVYANGPLAFALETAGTHDVVSQEFRIIPKQEKGGEPLRIFKSNVIPGAHFPAVGADEAATLTRATATWKDLSNANLGFTLP